MLKPILQSLSSLKLTIALMILAMVLIYAGTWAQVDADVWTVQKQYFHSFFTWIGFQIFFPRPQPGQPHIPGGFPMLGGYSIAILMLANLLAAHVYTFNLTARRIGIILIHLGLIVLLIGEILTSQLQVESRMTIDEGSFANYTEDSRNIELALVDPSPADHDNVVTISGARLARGGTIDDARLPFSVRVDTFFPNSVLVGPNQAPPSAKPLATAGAGVGVSVVGRPRVSGTEANAMDVPSAYVTLMKNGQSLGTYLVSLYIDRPQVVRAGDSTFHLQLRFARHYKPYTIHLLDFRHDRYLGTEIARNFSSRVRLVDPRNNVDREVLIWMNHPLRYDGETFYQASFKPGDKTTILQVVRNPSWLMPYIACIIGTIGLLVHFGIALTNFIRRQSTVPSPSPTGMGQHERVSAYTLRPQRSAILPIVITGACALYLLSLPFRHAPTRPFDLEAFGHLPITYEGRTQPLDSLARNSLRVLSGKQTFKADSHSQPAIQWLIDVFARPETAQDHRVFRIDHPDIIGQLKLDPDQKLFTARELLAKGRILQEQMQRAGEKQPRQRSLYERKVLELGHKLNLYITFGQLADLYLIPPVNSNQWRTFGEAIGQTSPSTRPSDPAAAALSDILRAYHDNNPATFNTAVGQYHSLLTRVLPASVTQRLRVEALFNRVEPFYQGMILYVLIFLLVVFSWLGKTGPLQRSAFWVLVLAIILHTLGLITRIYLQGRPPVTNLYSSAIFIAWGAVLLAAAVEYFFRNGVGSLTAAVTGFLSLLVAHNLAGDGDTMKMLQAVLDTNFWLATHVVTITLGYSATFLAGFLAILFVLRGVFTASLSKQESRNLARMIYGITCFALLFSFVGTILGGIWADQSWGRFWGWDPKENGAILIVLANAILLHARWAGIVRERGIALLAIVGNIVTAWSWFGTNMLGVGLHSYGFMDSALFWLLMFVLSQLALIALGLLPLRTWRSNTAMLV